ncbi:MAG TPA: right-handed parallel beta-helix repeat-containing protein [Silvibacterium sp.]|nr:right-handed parallel beta-helix repeat-containing protein [Silvibacterium sp.]
MKLAAELLVLFLLPIVSPAFQAGQNSNTALYVSPFGNDENPGSEQRPFRTLQHAADVAKPGTTVDVRGATYCQRLALHVSGNAARGYITFRSAPGERAVLDGGCLTPEIGPSAMVALHNVSYVRIQGLEIRHYKTADLLRTPFGIRVYGSGSHIQILDNDVHNIEQTYPGRIGSGHGANGFGIAVYGTDATTPISDLVVDSNNVHHLQTGSSESLVLNGNVTNFRVTRNTVHDNNNIGIDIIGFERTAPNPAVDRARDGVVSGNLVYDITSRGNPAYGSDVSSDGIYVDGGTKVLIERNVIHNVDFGLELASEHRNGSTSHIIARNNLIYSCHTAGITIGGYDRKRGTTEDTMIVNNTLYENDTQNTGTGEFQMQFYLRNNIFKNNIIYVGKSRRALNSRSGREEPGVPTVTLDHNMYYDPGGPSAVRWSFDGKEYGSFAQYRNATGNGKQSLFADPRFVDRSANNFHLRSDSPARNAGANLDSSIVGAKDLDGRPRVRGGKTDLGCYETQ